MGSIVEGQGTRAGVIFVLRECIWNAPLLSLVLPAFDNTGSLGSLPCRVIYPLGSTLGGCLLLPPAGNREVELKPTPFSSLLTI